jgi:hypothetical protein
MVNDSLSAMRFCGLCIEDDVPDHSVYFLIFMLVYMKISNFHIITTSHKRQVKMKYAATGNYEKNIQEIKKISEEMKTISQETVSVS